MNIIVNNWEQHGKHLYNLSSHYEEIIDSYKKANKQV